MIPQVLSLLNENKGVSILFVALTVVLLLGGTGTITLPADKKAAENATAIADLETSVTAQLAQGFMQQTTIHEQQRRALLQRDLKFVQSELRSLNSDIGRLNDLPDYLGRELNAEEQWQLDTLQQTWNILKDEEQELIEQLGEW